MFNNTLSIQHLNPEGMTWHIWSTIIYVEDELQFSEKDKSPNGQRMGVTQIIFIFDKQDTD